jgi:hypothetical protein
MLGLIFIGVGVVLLAEAAEIGFWELIFAVPLILFGIAGILAG